jgi:hypothetical protein
MEEFKETGAHLKAAAGMLLRPTPAASLARTFDKLSRLLFAVLWVLCLPAELILHRRVGKRYMNTFLLALSLVGIGLCAAAFVEDPLVKVAKVSGGWPASLSTEDRRQALTEMLKYHSAFNWLVLLTLAAFLAHTIANRRRFGTPAQSHSFDFGLPWMVYAPALWMRVFGMGRGGDDTAAGSVARPKRPIPHGPGGAAAAVAYPLTAVTSSLRRYWNYHTKVLRTGLVPYGPFSWLIISLIEPVLLVALGLALPQVSEHLAPFGCYMVFIGGCLFLKAYLFQTEWRERVYDDRDRELEAEAMQNLREGRDFETSSPLFTVPVSTAVLSGGRTRGVRTGMAGPGFDSFESGQGRPYEPKASSAKTATAAA